MTAKTFTSAGVNNLWSNAANWDLSTAPADNDSVTIPSGQTCEFDVDMSNAGTWPNGIDGLTITGTLKLSRTTSGYLKIKAAKTITGAGTFDCGASALDAIPFATKHTITGGAAWYISGASGLTMTVYAAEPSIKTVKLTGTESIGSTVLDIDTNITGDIWADGDTIRIDNVNQGVYSEIRTIAAGGRAAGTVTITAGLAAAKIAGTLIHLVTRNVRFVGVGVALLIRDFSSGKVIIAGGEYTMPSYSVLNNCPDSIVSGGTFTWSGYAINACNGILVSGGVFSGNSYHVAGCTGARVSAGAYSGSNSAFSGNYGSSISGAIISGNTYAIDYCQLMVLNCYISGNTYGTRYSSTTMFNNQFVNNSYDCGYSSYSSNNTLFASGTENYRYTYNAKEIYSESIDHDQTAGAFKSWTKGGVTTKQTTTKPTGKTYSMQLVLENATNEGFWQREITVGAGASINITSHLRKSASMAYLPRVIIFNKASTDPFAGGAGLDTFTMTNSVDTWESDAYTYYNSTSEDVTIVIRTQGMNASGNVFSLIEVEQINVDLTTLISNLAIVDTVVDAIKAKTDNLPSDPADQSAVEAAITAGIATIDTDSVLAATVEGTYSVQDIFKLMASVMAGKVSGGGTTTVTFRDLSDALDRVTATVDSNGNRSATTLDLS